MIWEVSIGINYGRKDIEIRSQTQQSPTIMRFQRKDKEWQNKGSCWETKLMYKNKMSKPRLPSYKFNFYRRQLDAHSKQFSTWDVEFSLESQPSVHLHSGAKTWHQASLIDFLCIAYYSFWYPLTFYDNHPHVWQNTEPYIFGFQSILEAFVELAFVWESHPSLECQTIQLLCSLLQYWWTRWWKVHSLGHFVHENWHWCWVRSTSPFLWDFQRLTFEGSNWLLWLDLVFGEVWKIDNCDSTSFESVATWISSRVTFHSVMLEFKEHTFSFVLPVRPALRFLLFPCFTIFVRY